MSEYRYSDFAHRKFCPSHISSHDPWYSSLLREIQTILRFRCRFQQALQILTRELEFQTLLLSHITGG